MSNLQSLDVIKLKNVTRLYPGVCAVDRVNFSVKKGRVHAFLGPNGAGKSTTLKMIAGILRPTSGEITIFNKNIHLPRTNLRVEIGFLPENPPLYMAMRVDDYLLFVSTIHAADFKYNQQHLADIYLKCGIDGLQTKIIGHLSKGQRQKIGVAQALVHNPSIIILDEPTAGLDLNAIFEIRKLIKSLEEDHTILLSTHNLHEAEILSSDLTIINHGKILQTGTMQELKLQMKSGRVINAKVKNWNAEIEKSIQYKFHFDTINVSHKNNSSTISFYDSKDEDIKADLSHELALQGCGVLDFGEKKISLEGLFENATQGENQPGGFL